MIIVSATTTQSAEAWRIGFTIVLGFIAVYALLPRPRRQVSPWLGCVAGAGALVAVCWLVMRPQTATVELVLFYCFRSWPSSARDARHAPKPVHAAIVRAGRAEHCGFSCCKRAFLMAATIIVYAGPSCDLLVCHHVGTARGPSDADFVARAVLGVRRRLFPARHAALLQLNYDVRALDVLLERTRRAAAGPPPARSTHRSTGLAGRRNIIARRRRPRTAIANHSRAILEDPGTVERLERCGQRAGDARPRRVGTQPANAAL